ncbi:MAG: hypothetical protein IKR48_04835 [Kiritimatiellae bacterium]|nr:hypothetical protein [Kiritimatiellia bacterium]
MRGNKGIGYWLALVLLPCVTAADPDLDVSCVVHAQAPGTVFARGEPLAFNLDSNAMQTVTWTCRDWHGKSVQSGDWPKDGKDTLVLTALSEGYYTLTLHSPYATYRGERSFVVVPPPGKRARNANQYYAVDTAQSWLLRSNKETKRYPANAAAVLSEIARRAGMEIVRERLSWSECEKQPGAFTWGQYQINADELSQRGVRVSGMFHDAPDWAVSGENVKLPSDLLATYRFTKKLAEHFRGKMTDWEFWNEQDITAFSPESAWEYASAMKAAYLGFKAGDTNVAVALGGLAITRPSRYSEVMMRNGLRDYIDIMNVHTYLSLATFPKNIGEIHDYMKRHGLQDRPLWFTENGSAQAEGNTEKESFIPGIGMHSGRQEMIVAEFLPKSMLLLQSLGVDRDFYFVLPPYNEGGGKKDWGLMRRDFSVKPAYAALSTLTMQLGNATLEGELAVGTNVRCFLFRQADGSQTLAYWSVSELDKGTAIPERVDRLPCGFRLTVEDGVYKGTDCFGMPFQQIVRKGGLWLTAERMVSYLNGLKGLRATKPFPHRVKRWAPAETPYDRSIVFRTELANGCYLPPEKNVVDLKGKTASILLQVWNLSETAKTGTVAVAGAKVMGIPQQFQLPPFGREECVLTFEPKLNDDFKGELAITGSFNGLAASELRMPLHSIEQMIASAKRVELKRAERADAWQKNASGEMEITDDAKEQGVRFHVRFVDAWDFWVYPELNLQLPQESLQDAIGISFETKVASLDKFKQMLLMVVPDGAPSAFLGVTKPSLQWEPRTVLFGERQRELEKAPLIRFGLNTDARETTFWIRNIRILKKNVGRLVPPAAGGGNKNEK